MNLYLLRHGIAARAEDATADSERPLTAKGIKRIHKAGRGLRRLGLVFDAILTSPSARAHQTARIVAETLGLEACLSEIETLQPNCSAGKLLASLSDYQRFEDLLLVGHEPLLTDFAASLLLDKAAASLTMALKKGGVCCIEIDSLPPREPGTLHWLLAPKQLRLLGGRQG